MPTYDLRNTETGEVSEMLLTISKKEEMIESGEWAQVHLGVPSLVSMTGNVVNKTSGDWKDLLKNMKKNSGGNYNDKLSSEKKKKYGLQDNTINT